MGFGVKVLRWPRQCCMTLGISRNTAVREVHGARGLAVSKHQPQASYEYVGG